MVDCRELKFGIEIEFTRINRSKAAEVIAKYFGTSATQIGGWGFDSYEVKDRQNRIWRVVRDGSVTPHRLENNRVQIATDDYKCELVSPRLDYEDIPTLQNVVRELRRAGAGTNSSTGIHVHVGAERFTPQSLRVLCNIVYAKQHLMYKAVQCHSSRQNRFCQPLSDGFIRQLNKKKPTTFDGFGNVWYASVNSESPIDHRYHDSRYCLLNLHNLLSGRFKTVEFRLFNGSLHAGEVKSYVQFSLLIVAQALNQHRATNRVTAAHNGNDKYAFRVWLLRMGAISDEFKTMRHHLLKHLEGNSAWRDPAAQTLAEIAE